MKARTLNGFGIDDSVPITFFDGHQIEPVIDAVCGFDDVKQAYADLDRGPFGKIVDRAR